MLVRILALVAAVAPFASAQSQITFSQPAAGASISAAEPLTVKFTSTGSGFTTYNLYLFAGGNAASAMAAVGTPIATAGQISTGASPAYKIDPTTGGTGTNAYFLQMTAQGPNGESTVVYSDRFTITGMSGTFPANVQNGLSTVTGTNGPTNPAAPGAAGSAAPAGEFATPYSMQTGLTKFAPMQQVPGTKITATNTSPLYPSTTVQIAKTWLPTPSQVTTLTQSNSISVSSQENTASPAPMPSNDMQKFLARWKD